jgi:hypothetical protein
MQQVRQRLTYANVVSTLALFLVLSGGAAFAASKLTTKDIRPGAIKTKLLARKAVKSGKIAPRAVLRRHLAPDSVGAVQLGPDSVGARQLAPNSVGARQLAPDSVDGSKVRDGSLTPADLLGGASVVATVDGGSTTVTATGVGLDPIALNGGGWTQGPAENDLFLARVDATLESAPAATCLIEVLINLDGRRIGTVFLSTSETEPTVVIEEQLLEGASVASGVPQTNQLGAGARRIGVGTPCPSAAVNSLRLVVLGVG